MLGQRLQLAVQQAADLEWTAFAFGTTKSPVSRRRLYKPRYVLDKDCIHYIMKPMNLSELAAQAMRTHRTTPSLVAEVLREAILRGVLKGGQPLPQDELAARFGLSRIPIREALRQLEGEGLVTVYPHRGAVVSELSGEELQEMCEIRIALETAAVRLAIPHLDGETLSRAEAILTATDRETDVVAHWSKNNWTFHSTLYMPAHRPRLARPALAAGERVVEPVAGPVGAGVCDRRGGGGRSGGVGKSPHESREKGGRLHHQMLRLTRSIFIETASGKVHSGNQ